MINTLYKENKINSVSNIFTLNIDTSNDLCSACLSLENEIIYDIVSCEKNTQSKNLFNIIEKIFAFSSINYSNIGKIIVTVGPGSFTGIRTGLAAINAVSHVLKIPCFGISNLQVIAYDGLAQKKIPAKEIISVIDARRNQLYVQGFSSDLLNAKDPTLVEIDNFSAEHKEKNSLIICDDATRELLSMIPDNQILSCGYKKLSAKNLVQSSVFFEKHSLLLPNSPVYIRQADAVAKFL